MLSGGEIDWDEIKRDSEEWVKLVEMARQPPLVPYVLAHGHYRGSEMERVNTAWAKLTARVTRREALIELTRLSEEMGGYDPRFYTQAKTETELKSTFPSTDRTQEPSTETKC